MFKVLSLLSNSLRHVRGPLIVDMNEFEKIYLVSLNSKNIRFNFPIIYEYHQLSEILRISITIAIIASVECNR